MDRRFQLRGEAAGVSVIDDYGHHPTEIRATLAAARQCGFRKVHVVFQPHRYTRTRESDGRIRDRFPDADSLFVLDIYPASEQPIEGITGEALAKRITEKGGRSAIYVGSFADAVASVASAARPGETCPSPWGGQRLAARPDRPGKARQTRRGPALRAHFPRNRRPVSRVMNNMAAG